ncbi:MAG: RluA family pseudouridine synthase [Clostridia bacterium]|nr:RluA family pseudouridine synthase [Clostridia bacterium]
MRILSSVIDESYHLKSVHDYLRRKLEISVALVKKIKATKRGITVNGEDVFVSHILQKGDVIEIIIDDGSECSENIPFDEGDIDVVFEDQDLLIVNKPAGQPIHPSLGNYHGSLAGIVMNYYRKKGENFVFRPVNRLDKGTSGLTVIAKNAHCHQRLKKQQHTGDFIRKYLAVAEGILEDSGCINEPIGRTDDSIIKRCVRSDGNEAITYYETLKKSKNRSLLSLTLKTGRTHQIRVHLSYIGHPLTGDFLYGTETDEIQRFALHSSYIAIKHPITENFLEFNCPIPEDMQKLL